MVKNNNNQISAESKGAALRLFFYQLIYMSSTRLFYDRSAENARLKASMGSGNYVIQTPKQYTCYPDEGILAQRSGYMPNIGVENSLLNMNQSATRYDQDPDQLNENFANHQYAESNRFLFFLPEQCGFNVEYTRLTNPPSTLKGTGINRFDPICLDPQARIFFPGQQNLATQMMAKDNYRRCVRRHNINSMHPDQSIEYYSKN